MRDINASKVHTGSFFPASLTVTLVQLLERDARSFELYSFVVRQTRGVLERRFSLRHGRLHSDSGGHDECMGPLGFG